MLSVIDTQIIDKIKEIKESNKRLEYLTGTEKTKESYHNGNLYLELRKLTKIANDYGAIYCSRCGLKFRTFKQRITHVSKDH